MRGRKVCAVSDEFITRLPRSPLPPPDTVPGTVGQVHDEGVGGCGLHGNDTVT